MNEKRNYRDKGATWLMEHAYQVAFDMSGGNQAAANAIAALLNNIAGARAFYAMRVELTPEEWDKLYKICDNNADLLCLNVAAINKIKDRYSNADMMIRDNLKLERSVLFTDIG